MKTCELFVDFLKIESSLEYREAYKRAQTVKPTGLVVHHNGKINVQDKPAHQLFAKNAKKFADDFQKKQRETITQMQ